MDRKRQLEEKERNLHRMTFTLPREIFDQMSELAKRNRRSTTQEMIFVLERYINMNKDLLEKNNG